MALNATSSSSNGGVVCPGVTETVPGADTHAGRRCCDVHCNTLWSIWYGILVIALQSFLVYQCVQRFLLYIALPWPDGDQPYLELNLFVGLVGAAVVLTPFFLVAFSLKVGNLANDGYKLGRDLSACAMDPPSVLARSSGVIRNAWHHGGPTAPFIHLVSAFCFILPKFFIEAKLIDVGFLAQDRIWKTDLDWLVPHHDRLVILRFLTGAAVNATTITTEAPYHHPAAQIRAYLEELEPWFPVSPEFFNYALALVVYSVRYPAVFWNTNKAFAFIFSMQLVANSIQNLLCVGAMSIMYKVLLLGPQNVLHKYEPFLTSSPAVCITLYLLSGALVLTSSCVLYMYGYSKFSAFVDRERDRHSIRLRAEGPFSSLWAYFPHCAALCLLIAMAVVNAPLIYDFTLIYRGSLDGAVLLHVISTVIHLFLWIVLWLFLTIKQSWQFKLRVTVGRAVVKQARSIKLVNDIDLNNRSCAANDDNEDEDADQSTMLIVSHGKSYTVSEAQPKKLIMSALARAAIRRDKEQEEQERGVVTNNSTQSPARQKVTFQGDRSSIVGSPRPDHYSSPQSPRPSQQVIDGSEVDASSHALSSPLVHHHESNNQQRTAAAGSNNNDDTDCDDLPPPPEDEEKQHLLPNTAVTAVAAGNPGGQAAAIKRGPQLLQNPEVQDVHTPRSNRSVDSGLPHDDITPRSDSLSTASSSASPPDQQHNQQQLMMQQQQAMMMTQREIQQQHRKSTSMDGINIKPPQLPDGQQQQQQQQWKGGSLQRGMQPPNVADPIYGSLNGDGNESNNGTLVIRRKGVRPLPQPAVQDDEDPYGRCLNMKVLTSFSEGENGNGKSNGNRDPRIIDLTHSNASSTNSVSVASTPRQGSPVHQFGLVPHHAASQFNTLPAQVPNNSGISSGVLTNGNGTAQQRMSLGVGGGGRQAPTHNTLPARVNGGSYGAPSSASRLPPIGRHFKPFDHRRLNIMADIQENQEGPSNSPAENPYAIYNGPQREQQQPQPPPPLPESVPVGSGGLIVQKKTHIPHMPSELRHTNYSSQQPQPNNPVLNGHGRLANQVLEHHRDSANFSLTSSDSG